MTPDTRRRAAILAALAALAYLAAAWVEPCDGEPGCPAPAVEATP